MKHIKLLLLGLALGGGVFVLDRWTKLVFSQHPTQPVLGNFFGITSHQNYGFLANVAAPRIFIIALTSLIICGVFYAFMRSIKKSEMLQTVAFALILAGALGNLFDRIFLGYVFDWMLFFNISILNIADLSVGLGVLILLIGEFSVRAHTSVRPYGAEH